jgi:hypothetical protein
VARVDLTQASYRTLLLGMKGKTSYAYKIVATNASGSCTGGHLFLPFTDSRIAEPD